MIRHAALVAALSLTLAGASACGSEPSPDDQSEQIAEQIVRWTRDAAAGKDEVVCAQLTAELRDRLVRESPESESCEALVDELADALSDEEKRALDRLEIRHVHVDGDRAEVHDRDVSAPKPWVRDDNGEPIVLRRVDGRWLIEDMG